MKKQVLNGFASLVLPFATYAAPSLLIGGGYYQRNTYISSGASIGQEPSLRGVRPVNHQQKSVELGLGLITGQVVNELVVIDAAVPDKHVFYGQLKPGVEVVEISADQDGLLQLQTILAKYRGLSALHIISHASPGKLHLGNSAITQEALQQRENFFATLQQALREGGDLLLYGCDLAADEDGRALLSTIRQETGLDITASNDRTGSASQGGNWELEIALGKIEAGLPFQGSAREQFQHVLASFSVSTLGELRTALATAASNNEADTITVTGNISAAGGGDMIASPTDGHPTFVDINITDGFDLQIIGGGNTLDANYYGRVLEVRGGAVDISNLIIREGLVSGDGGDRQTEDGEHALGGGIRNAGNLVMRSSTITANGASGGGGGGGGNGVYGAGGGGGGGGLSFTGGGDGGLGGPNNYAGNAGGVGVGGNGGDYTTPTNNRHGGRGGTTSGGLGGSAAGYISGGAGATASNGSLSIGGGGGGASYSGAGRNGGNAAGAIFNSGTLTIINTTVANNVGSGGGGGGGANSFFAGSGGNGGTGVGGIWNTGTLRLDATSSGSLATNSGGAGSGGAATAPNSSGSVGSSATHLFGNAATNLDSDGNLTAAAGVTEPVGLNTTADSVGEAVDVFDFTLSDGAGGDLQPLTVSQVVVNVSGTSTDAERGQITWRLNGPDASNVAGTYNAGTDTITFSGLSISVADGGNETYTVNAFFNDNTNVVEDRTIILSIDGDTDLTTAASGTQMGATSAVTNGTGTTIDVVASTLAFTTQPAGSVSGSVLTTQPVVVARDAFGNTDVDFTETITLTEASAGTLTNNTQAAIAGVATFTNLIYTATADQQSFTLTANDQDGVGSNLATVDANAVTADVVATQLVFDTQPAPTSVISGANTSFTTVPVVSAQDANSVVDTGYSTDIILAEVNGAGSATLSGTGDNDGSAATVSITPSSGVSTFTGLAITYTNIGASETFNLRASSGGLTTTDSSQFTSLSTPAVSDGSISISGASGTGGAFRIGDTITATWDNTGGGDGNTGISGVTVDFSEFGGGAAVVATNSSDTWTATYTLVSGAIDNTNRNISVTATNGAGPTTTADTTNATVDNIAPTVTDGRISISGGTGIGGAFITGDTVTATWNNTAGGDNNSDTISGVTVDFSQFGGGAAVVATNSAGTWTATYTVTAGAIDDTNRNVSVTAADNANNTTTVADSTNATVDNVAPTVTDARIGISGASGTGGAFVIGDTVTATWDNTGSGDNNVDTINSVTVDFTQFGGGAAVVATNSSGTWTASYTIVAGAIDAANRNVSVTATDNAGNTTTTADTTNATVDNIAPTISSVSVPANATYSAGQNLDFTVNASENITVDTLGGTPRIALTIGATTQYASYLSGGGTSALVFRYTVQAGDNDTDGIAVAAALEANGGSMRDGAGINLNTTLNSLGSTASVLVDAVAPTVVSVSVPANANYRTGQNLDFTVNASENVTVNTGGGTPRIALTIGATTRYASYLSGSGTSAIVFRYTVQIGDNDADGIAVAAALDTNGGTLRDGASNNLTTTLNSVGATAGILVDTVAPTATSSTPAGAAVANDASVVFTVDFDETVYGITTGGFALTATGTAAGTVASVSAVSGTSVAVTVNTITGTGTLRLDTDGTGIADLAGNLVPAFTAGTSHSVDRDAPAITSVAFDQASVDNGNQAAISMTLAGAETGSTLNYTITSSAGGTPVTGSAAVVAAGQQITGINTSGLNDGTLTVSLTLTDTAGNESSAVTDTVSKDANLPAVSSVVIADGDYREGDIITVTVSLNEDVTVSGGNSTLALDIGSNTRQAAFVSENAGVLTYSYTVQAGDNTTGTGVVALASSITLNGDTIRDGGNNDADLSYNQVTNSSAQVDTAAPVNPVVTTPANAVSVNTPSYAISGSHAENGVVINLYADSNNDGVADNATVLETATVASNAWSITYNLTLDSANNLVVIANDAAANASATIDVPTITQDSIAPAAPAALDLAAASDSGSSDTDNLTNLTTVTITGTAEANAAVTLNSDVDDDVGSTTADGAGDWSIDTSALSAGEHSLTATATDAATNTSVVSTALVITVDTEAPSLGAIADQGVPLNGTTAPLAFTLTDNQTAAADITPTAASSNTAVVALVDVVLGGSGENRTVTVTGTGSGSSTITVSATDAAGNTADEPFVVTVNSAPTIGGVPATSVNQDVAYSFVPSAGDLDGDGLLFSITNLPAWASFNTATGALTGTPSRSDVGSYAGIVIAVTDGITITSLPSFDIAVVYVNAAPSISGTPALSVDQDQAYSFTPTASDTDSGDTLTFSITNQPAWASFNTSTGALTGTPTNSDVGVTNGVVVSVSDGTDTSALAAFNLTVVNVNDAPTASNDSYTLAEAGLLQPDASAGVLANDEDIDGDTLIATLITAPTRASQFTLNADGSFNYLHDGSETLSDSFTYEVSDGTVEVGPVTVSLTINPVNDAPEFITTPDQTTLNQGDVFFYDIGVNDPDSVVTLTLLEAPQWLSLSDSQLMGVVPDDASGTVTVRVEASDTQFDVIQAFDLTLVAVDDPILGITTQWSGLPSVTGQALGLAITVNQSAGAAEDDGMLRIRIRGVAANAVIPSCAAGVNRVFICPVSVNTVTSQTLNLALTPTAVGDLVVELELLASQDAGAAVLASAITDVSVTELTVSQGNTSFNLANATALAGINLLNDGTRELVAGTSLGDTVKLLDFTPTALSAQVIGEIDNRGDTRQVRVVDVNQDAAPDIVVVNRAGDTTQVYYNDGSGNFAADVANIDFAYGNQALLRDLNDDGFPELILGANGFNLYIYPNNNGQFDAQPYVFNSPATVVHFALLRRELSDDPMAGSFAIASRTAVFFVRFGIAGFGALQVEGDAVKDKRDVIPLVPFASLAADGTVSTNAIDPNQQLPIANVTSLQLADLDGDDREEIIVSAGHSTTGTNYAGVTVVNVAGNGDLTETARLGDASAHSVNLADFDGDGFADLLVGNDNATYQFYYGGGTTTSWTLGETIIFQQSPLVISDDVNDDGLSDVVIYNDSDEAVELYLSVANGDLGVSTDLQLASAVERVSSGNFLFNYHLDVANNGSNLAQNVRVRFTLPNNVTVATLPVGCTVTAGDVECDLGNMAADALTSVTIGLQGDANMHGQAIDSRVTSDALEQAPANNLQSVSLSSLFPSAQVQVKGGGGGGAINGLTLLMLLLGLAYRQRRLLVLFAALLFAGQSQALERDQFYAEVIVGQATSDWSTSSFNRKLATVTAGGAVSDVDDERITWSALAGYQLTPWLSVEGGWMDWGEVDLRIDALVTDEPALRQMLKDEYPLSGAGPYAGARVTYTRVVKSQPINLFAKAGVWFWKGDYDITISTTRNSVEQDGSDLVFGIGADTPVYNNINLGVSLQRVELSSDAQLQMGVNIFYHF